MHIFHTIYISVTLRDSVAIFSQFPNFRDNTSFATSHLVIAIDILCLNLNIKKSIRQRTIKVLCSKFIHRNYSLLLFSGEHPAAMQHGNKNTAPLSLSLQGTVVYSIFVYVIKHIR